MKDPSWARWFRSIAAIVMLVTVGCDGHFAPTAPRSPGVAEGLRARITRFEAWPNRHRPLASVFATFEEAPADARIVSVALADSDQSSCDSGDLAESIAVDGDTNLRAIRPGSEVIVTFPNERLETLKHPGRVDIVVSSGGAQRCLALDFTSNTPDLGWTYGNLVDVGLVINVSTYTRPVVGSVTSIQAIALAGHWVGPVRLAIGTGGTLDICNGPCCRGPESDADLKADVNCPSPFGGGFPIALRADVFPVERGSFALGFGMHYLFVAMGSRLQEGVSLAAYHTLTLAPIAALALRPLGPGYPGGPKAGTLGLEFPIGIATAVNDYTRPALSLGVTASFIF